MKFESDFNVAFLLALSLAAFGLWLIVGWAKISERGRNWLFDNDREGEKYLPGLRASTRGEVVSIHSQWFFHQRRLRRFIVEVLECPTCFGTWTGIGFGIYIGAGLPPMMRFAAILWFACMLAASNTILAASISHYLNPPTIEE